MLKNNPSVLITTLNAKYIHLNLAVRLLYHRNKANFPIAMREFTIKEDLDTVADYCVQFDVVAFSCYIWNITPTLRLISKMKALRPEVKIMLGGPEVSYDAVEMMQQHAAIDFIIIGEGEIPFRKFLEQFPAVHAVEGLVYRTKGEIVSFPGNNTVPMEELADLRPYEGDAPEELEKKVAYIETSRGCPYKCEFCLASLDNKVRYLPMEAIKENLLYLMQHGKVIKFLDRTFNIKKDFTLEIFDFILQHHRPGNVFQFEITADILHPDIIRYLHEKVPKGLFRFEIGIQTVNQKANLEVSRKQNFEKTKKIIQSVQDVVELHLDLIVGLPLDFWEDVRYSFEEVFKLFAPELQMGFLKFLKGTPVRQKYAQYDFEFDPLPPYQIIRSKFLSEKELADLTLVENALEIYWNKKRACETLKYVCETYNAFDFLLETGRRFSTRYSWYKYGLYEVYEIGKEQVLAQFPEDKIILELLCLDYFKQYKVKPKDFFEVTYSREEKALWAPFVALDEKKFRYMAFPIHFHYETWLLENRIVPAEDVLVLAYDGVNYPEVFSKLPTLALEQTGG